MHHPEFSIEIRPSQSRDRGRWATKSLNHNSKEHRWHNNSIHRVLAEFKKQDYAEVSQLCHKVDRVIEKWQKISNTNQTLTRVLLVSKEVSRKECCHMCGAVICRPWSFGKIYHHQRISKIGFTVGELEPMWTKKVDLKVTLRLIMFYLNLTLGSMLYLHCNCMDALGLLFVINAFEFY